MSKSSKTQTKRSADAGLDESAMGAARSDPPAMPDAPDPALATQATEAVGADAPKRSTAPQPAADVFRPLEGASGEGPVRDLEMIMDIPVKLSVELGRTRLTIKQLLELAQGSVVELDGLPGEPMDILINGYLIARGEVVVVEDKFGIRITEIVTPSERLHRLNS